jgi:hypothetical protein
MRDILTECVDFAHLGQSPIRLFVTTTNVRTGRGPPREMPRIVNTAAWARHRALVRSGAPVVYLLGGWAPPLGVALRGDGLSVVMLIAVAVVICAIAVFARGDFATPAGVTEARAPLTFWTLLLAVWGSLNLVLVKVDLFTLYVALELLTFAAVPLVCLDCASRLVRRDAGAGELGLHAVARRSRRGGRFVRQHRRAATKGIEAPHCILDGRAVRIPILDVSARLRPRYREARERRRFAGGILQALSHATPIGRFPPANSLALEALARALWLLIPGSALARALGSWDQHSAPFGMVVLIAALSPARRGDLAFGRLIEQVDGMLRQWPAACVSLLVVALLLGAALMAAR